MGSPIDSDHALTSDAHAFELAWGRFTEACGDTIAPEATYQAWLAHFVIQDLDLLRVVREVDFGARHLGTDAAQHFKGHNLMVDLLVLRDPIVNLPRRSWLGLNTPLDGQPNPRSGLLRLRDFSVITELKVSASQGGGLGQVAVLRDFRKLSAILKQAAEDYGDAPLPAAFVGVFDNHRNHQFNFDLLRRNVSDADIHPGVKLLAFRSPARPHLPRRRP